MAEVAYSAGCLLHILCWVDLMEVRWDNQRHETKQNSCRQTQEGLCTTQEQTTTFKNQTSNGEPRHLFSARSFVNLFVSIRQMIPCLELIVTRRNNTRQANTPSSALVYAAYHRTSLQHGRWQLLSFSATACWQMEIITRKKLSKRTNNVNAGRNWILCLLCFRTSLFLLTALPHFFMYSPSATEYRKFVISAVLHCSSKLNSPQKVTVLSKEKIYGNLMARINKWRCACAQKNTDGQTRFAADSPLTALAFLRALCLFLCLRYLFAQKEDTQNMVQSQRRRTIKGEGKEREYQSEWARERGTPFWWTAQMLYLSPAYGSEPNRRTILWHLRLGILKKLLEKLTSNSLIRFSFKYASRFRKLLGIVTMM